MKTIRILKIQDQFLPYPRSKLNTAAQRMSEQTGFTITLTESGFSVSGEWRGKFETEDAFASRIARDLQLLSGVLFDSVVEG
jgi:hypothetical protein